MNNPDSDSNSIGTKERSKQRQLLILSQEVNQMIQTAARKVTYIKLRPATQSPCQADTKPRRKLNNPNRVNPTIHTALIPNCQHGNQTIHCRNYAGHELNNPNTTNSAKTKLRCEQNNPNGAETANQEVTQLSKQGLYQVKIRINGVT